MKKLKVKEIVNSLAAALFFGIGMLVLNPRYMRASSSWDYIVLQLLTFLNGLGLCLVIGLLVNALWINPVLLRNNPNDDASKKVP